nr:DUF1304 family protein [Agrococcus sp. KRD186]
MRWEQLWTRRIFGTTAEQAAQSKRLAANQGIDNLLLGIAAIAGVVLLMLGVTDAELAVVLTAIGIMLGASARRLLRAALAT